MPRVVPSQVRAFIDQLPLRTMTDAISHNQVGSARLSALLDLLEEIPEQLLTMDTDQYADFITAKAQIQDILDVWTSNRNAGHQLTTSLFHAKTDPVGRIRAALDQCPDESPAPGTAELRFITDADLRANLRNDLGAINVALSNGIATTTLQTACTLTSTVPADLEDWVLHQYTEVAPHLGAIGPTTATEVRLARGFRNLIHPGRAQRLGQACDRGTALSCVAALEHVVRDLS
ncbi:MAG TPA: hypothetical protein VN749_17595 [Candidatus Eisenbacteria bacterium]|nr:hypothetical protein [Candidatus Eisenbacteria bacterium]